MIYRVQAATNSRVSGSRCRTQWQPESDDGEWWWPFPKQSTTLLCCCLISASRYVRTRRGRFSPACWPLFFRSDTPARFSLVVWCAPEDFPVKNLTRRRRRWFGGDWLWSAIAATGVCVCILLWRMQSEIDMRKFGF